MRRPGWSLAVLALSLCVARSALAQDGMAAVRLGAGGPLSLGTMPAPGLSGLFAQSGSALPGWLRWALSPQPEAGGATSGAGLAAFGNATGYRGMSWSVPLAGGLLHQDDALSFGFTLGHGLADVAEAGPGADRGLLPQGSYLHLGAGLSYQVTPRLGLYVLFDHIAGGGPLREDESVNDLGMRVGLHF